MKIVLLLGTVTNISNNSIVLKSKLVAKISNNRKNKRHMKLLRQKYLSLILHSTSMQRYCDITNKLLWFNAIFNSITRNSHLNELLKFEIIFNSITMNYLRIKRISKIYLLFEIAYALTSITNFYTIILFLQLCNIIFCY